MPENDRAKQRAAPERRLGETLLLLDYACLARARAFVGNAASAWVDAPLPQKKGEPCAVPFSIDHHECFPDLAYSLPILRNQPHTRH